jgi:hypothetical protein
MGTQTDKLSIEELTMNTKTTMLACIIAAGTTAAHADLFTWFAGSGLWEDPAMWNGPIGQYPDSILDTAIISGSSTDAQLNQNLALGALTVLDGATVYSSSNSIFVSGHTEIDGIGSNVTVTPSSSLRDFDTDTLNITEGIIVMYGGLAQIDESFTINGTGGVLGTGTIEMNSTTGDLVLNGGGALWAMGNTGPNATLLLTRTDSSTSQLDWTHPNTDLIVWDERTMINELPYTGPLGGQIILSSHEGSVVFESTSGFLGANTSEFRFSGDNEHEARIIAPAIDMYGDVTVSADSIIESSLVALRGNIQISQEAFFGIQGGYVTLDSVQISGSENTSVNPVSASEGTLNITGGLTEVVMGNLSVFDLDGPGNRTVNIADGSTLWVQAEYLDGAIFDEVGGTLNIDGALHVEPVNGANSWASEGDILLDGGEITGRTLYTSGLIQGTGTVDASVVNNGEIIADGGTLQFDFVSMDGNASPATGILRAQTGDLVMNMNSNGGSHTFTGSIFVGDGVGIREVFQADVNLRLQQDDFATGSMHLNSGFVSLHDFTSYGEMIVDGISLLRTTGGNEEDRISFSIDSETTINGTLEVDGRTWFVPSAQFSGNGTIDGVSTVRGIYFQDGADLGTVSLEAAGLVYLSNIGFVGSASMHALHLDPTSTLDASLSNFQETFEGDLYSVTDSAHLDGTLRLGWLNGGDVPVDETVTILEATSISGAFDEIDFSDLGPNRRAFVTVTDTTVDVFVTCFADLNADGQANFFDASEFMVLFNSQNPMADLNTDGEFNFFDVSAFISAFDMGCGG